MSDQPTLDSVRSALVKLHWEELTARKPDPQWLKALEDSARTMKRLSKVNGR